MMWQRACGDDGSEEESADDGQPTSFRCDLIFEAVVTGAKRDYSEWRGMMISGKTPKLLMSVQYAFVASRPSNLAHSEFSVKR